MTAAGGPPLCCPGDGGAKMGIIRFWTSDGEGPCLIKLAVLIGDGVLGLGNTWVVRLGIPTGS